MSPPAEQDRGMGFAQHEAIGLRAERAQLQTLEVAEGAGLVTLE